MKLTTNPLISVVMPVHNALPFLDESVGSILKQTLSDFEFVIGGFKFEVQRNFV